MTGRWRINPGVRLRLAFFCGLSVLIFCTIPRTCAEEETDFEFDDNLQVKRDGDNSTTVGVPPYSSGGKGGNRTGDDEAMMVMDEAGSGKEREDEEEMSGSSPLPDTSKVPPRPTTSKALIRTPTRTPPSGATIFTPEPPKGESEYFRSTINFTSVTYNPALNSRTSPEFLQLAFQIQYAIEDAFRDIPGKQSATVIQFRPGSLDPEAKPSVIATIDFETVDFYNNLVLFNVLNGAVNRGRLGSMTVSPHGFSFRPLGGNGVVCPTSIGREPTSLPRREDTKANLMLNNRFICDGFLTEVAYFRGSPEGAFFIGVWKQDTENSFILRHRIEVPPAPIGIHRLRLPEPLPVERGDFLGIHYPRATSEGVIVHSIREDGVIPAQEMFQTLVIDVFDEDLPTDRTIDVERFTKWQETKTFALLGVLSTDGAYPATSTTIRLPIVCLDSEFRCNDGVHCLHISQKCDGRRDCDDGSDEFEDNCRPSRCESDEFLCNRSGQCIEIFRKCDRYRDCDDGSDEADCACKTWQFHCDNGWCIELQHVCDGRNDCGDRSDEMNCEATSTLPPAPPCTSDQFHCGDGNCIRVDQVCNRDYDCPDGSDEYDCPLPECVAGREFRCTDGTCIDASLHCDEHPDCPDESDESDCPAPVCDPRTQFTCKDGTCVDISGYCDRTKYDCPDGSDETDCEPPTPPSCGAHEFSCSDGSSCIALHLICNQQYDCPDGSDEFRLLCDVTTPQPPPCDPDTEFTCRDGTCVDISGRCDRTKYDCADGTDEYDCERSTTSTLPPRDCDSSQFTCTDGTCISNHLICDHRHDCSDGSDEFECAETTLEPTRPTCDPRTEFTCRDGTCVDISGRCDRTKYDCADGTDEFDCDVPPTPEGYCEPYQEFTCGDGTCVNIERKCDGRFDCRDRSDEHDCDKPTQSPLPSDCDPRTKFTCRDGTCVDISGRCDRTKYDCADGTDEFDCEIPTQAPHTPPPTQSSLGCNLLFEFTCRDGSCVDISGRCDRTKYDCVDGTDEYDCDVTERPKTDCDPRTEFTCRDGTCVDISGRCDRTKYDCVDGTDEFDCGSETPRPTPPAPRCDHSYEFSCGDGSCIELTQKCDETFDCRDGTDEDDCETPTPPPPPCDPRLQFTCENGACVDISGRCDRTKYDCADGTDEFNCDGYVPEPRPCEPYLEFTCRDGACIDTARKCDGRFDCSDRSDEQGCVAPVTDEPTCDRRTEFSCGDGACIDIDYRCDGRFDCRDRSDEHGCVSTTPKPVVPVCDPRTEFTCRDGTCVDISGRCDRTKYDCADGTDEFDCDVTTPSPYCEPYQEFTCGDGTCVDIERKCDGRFDCRDRSDEHNCDYTPAPTPPRWCEPYQEFTCTDGSCVDIAKQCDGHFDCADGSDERGCAVPTTPEPLRPGCDRRLEFTCRDGTCVDISGRCDRTKYDCVDGTDEFDCDGVTAAPPPGCDSSKFTCHDGSCIYLDQKCDGRYDCRDESDEDDCEPEVIPTVEASPSRLRQRVGLEAVFTCFVFGSTQARPQWLRRHKDLPRHARVEDGRLIISPLVVEDTGEYYCTVAGVHGVVPAVVSLTVDDVFGPTTSRPPLGRCNQDEGVCGNGDCVARDYFCDGDYDCTDRSDEENCLGQTPCEPNEFQCGNGKCILKIWRCDGDNDCADSSDERNCALSPHGGACGASEFNCSTLQQCIPAAYQCDGELDCQDQSDEKGCVAPRVTKPPPREVTAGLGDTITIDCEAFGVPPPLIVWRLNWGHTGTAPRVTSRTDRVMDSRQGVTISRGVITITDARKEDEGAYTCEALNSKGSILADPDTIVHVIPPRGVCQAPYFNIDAHHTSDCVECFCFGVTQDCTSSNLYLSQLATTREMAMVDFGSRTKLELNGEVVDFDSRRNQFVIRNYADAMSGTGYYWSLPTGFLGNKVTSYGGKLSYTIYYDTPRSTRLEPGPDVFLYGNRISLYHTEFFRPFSGIEQSPEIF